MCLFSLLEVKNRLYFGIYLATLCLIRVDNHCNSGEQIGLSLAWLYSLEIGKAMLYMHSVNCNGK